MNISESQRAIQNDMRKLQQGERRAAAKAAQAGAKRFLTSHNLQNLAGTALRQAGDHVAAAKAYSNLYKLAPNDVNVRMTFGISLVHAERFDIAHKLAEEWLDAELENPNFRYLKALAAIGQKEFEVAESETTRALAEKPDMERSLAVRGLARFELISLKAHWTTFDAPMSLLPIIWRLC